MYSEIFGGGLSVLNRIGDLLRRGGASDSLIGFTEVGRVEPNVLIDRAALDADCIGEVQQSLLAIFSGYWLQAVSLSNTIGNVRVMDRLEALNPSRNPVNTALNTFMIATESYEYGLPFPDYETINISLESAGMGSLGGSAATIKLPIGMGSAGGQSSPNSGGSSKPGKPGAAQPGSPDYDPTKSGGAPVSKNPLGTLQSSLSKSDISKTLTELANLSIGKAYEVNLVADKTSVPVIVNIRLIASTISTRELIHILATGSEDNSIKERLYGWKAGKLSFWKDLVFMNDLIDKHRSDLMKDKTGTLQAIDRQKVNNTISSLISGSPTISSATNLVVLTKDTAQQLELELEGRLDKFDIRQRLIKKTGIMIMAIIDEVDYNQVTFYHRNIPQPTTVRIKDLKGSNKGNGPDIESILKSLMGGHAPAI